MTWWTWALLVCGGIVFLNLFFVAAVMAMGSRLSREEEEREARQ